MLALSDKMLLMLELSEPSSARASAVAAVATTIGSTFAAKESEWLLILRLFGDRMIARFSVTRVITLLFVHCFLEWGIQNENTVSLVQAAAPCLPSMRKASLLYL